MNKDCKFQPRLLTLGAQPVPSEAVENDLTEQIQVSQSKSGQNDILPQLLNDRAASVEDNRSIKQSL